ncbi:MAG: dual specificity protein phosphatase family protein [Deltaproteobacteria bacterium]|nr:dual specificity protein phosphatase family protein [Deltaproteobacteria bacterium]
MPGNTYQLDWVTEYLAVGGAPTSYQDLEAIRWQGIDAVMNLCAEFCDLHWLESGEGFEVYYLPIHDEEAPDVDALDQALDWLDETISLGRKVLIHCRVGIGRTGTVVSAYLLRQGWDKKAINRKLKKLRARPVNFTQWWFIRKYGAREPRVRVEKPDLMRFQSEELRPLWARLECLMEMLDRPLYTSGSAGLCGEGHQDCCFRTVSLSLIESGYLSRIISLTLGRLDRRMVVNRAMEMTQLIDLQDDHQDDHQGRPNNRSADGDSFQRPPRAGFLCSLNELGECLVFESRPAVCRLFDLSEENRQLIMPRLEVELTRLSRDFFFSLTSSRLDSDLSLFPLYEVASGKFAEQLFHLIEKRPGSG